MERDEIEKEVRAVLAKESYGARMPMGFSSNESLFLRGIVDSFGIFPLVRVLEARFKIKIKKSDIHPGTLETIDHITRFIKQKKTGAKT